MPDILSFIQFNQYNLPAIVGIIGGYLLFIWLAVVAWVLRDISARSRNLLVIIFSLAFVLIGNLPALVIYLLIRPEKTLEDTKEHDLFYASILDKNITVCSSCQSLVRNDFNHCPSCGNSLLQTCAHCGTRINSLWRHCPNCSERLIKESPVRLTFKSIVTQAKRIMGLFPKLFTRIKLFFANRLKKLPKFEFSLPKNQVKVVSPAKAIAEKKYTKNPGAEKVLISGFPINTATTKVITKRGRGRPKGVHDANPRRKRADAGRSRGKYKKESAAQEV